MNSEMRVRLLASVRSVEEAALALECGADWIDLKEPSHGALGALPVAAIRAVVDHVAGRAPVSATIGDIVAVEQAVRSVARVAECRVDAVKVGFFPGADFDAQAAALAPLARRHRLVAVCFAEQLPSGAAIDSLAERRFAGAMLDTMAKRGSSLRDLVPSVMLRAFVERVRGNGLLCGLAGSLTAADIPSLLPLEPDYLGFRGALCEGGRGGRLSRTALMRIRRALVEDFPPSPNISLPETLGAA